MQTHCPEPLCQAVSDSKDAMIAHLKDTHKSLPFSCRCYKCPKKFRTLEGLNYHCFHSGHDGIGGHNIYKVYCNYCQQPFQFYSWSRNFHIRRHLELQDISQAEEVIPSAPVALITSWVCKAPETCDQPSQPTVSLSDCSHCAVGKPWKRSEHAKRHLRQVHFQGPISSSFLNDWIRKIIIVANSNKTDTPALNDEEDGEDEEEEVGGEESQGEIEWFWICREPEKRNEASLHPTKLLSSCKACEKPHCYTFPSSARRHLRMFHFESSVESLPARLLDDWICKVQRPAYMDMWNIMSRDKEEKNITQLTASMAPPVAFANQPYYEPTKAQGTEKSINLPPICHTLDPSPVNMFILPPIRDHLGWALHLPISNRRVPDRTAEE